MTTTDNKGSLGAKRVKPKKEQVKIYKEALNASYKKGYELGAKEALSVAINLFNANGWLYDTVLDKMNIKHQTNEQPKTNPH